MRRHVTIAQPNPWNCDESLSPDARIGGKRNHQLRQKIRAKAAPETKTPAVAGGRPEFVAA
jgi:hypothetical protein